MALSRNKQRKPLVCLLTVVDSAMESTSHSKFINKDWIKTNEGELAVQQLYSPKNQKIRRNFGNDIS